MKNRCFAMLGKQVYDSRGQTEISNSKPGKYPIEDPIQSRPILASLPDARLSDVVMLLVGVWWGQESEAEVAFITVRATEWAYEKEGVKDVLQESFSSGLVVSLARAVRTNSRLIEDRHGLHLPF
jgi:hypothetical protein